MQAQNFLVRDRLFGGVLFHETQRGEIIDHLALGAGGDGGDFPAFLHGADLFQRERIALNGR